MMKSRSIIAKGIMNGYFTSWCWVNSDFKNIGDILFKYFCSNETVEELIRYKSILGLFLDPKDDDNTVLKGSYARLSNGIYVKYDDGVRNVVVGGLNGFIKSVPEIMKYDVEYVYIWENNGWIVYKK
ncbi:MAG: hypothetical protein IJI14_14790 [Anaerolineaceae bacterium]|nr:hypothetical protein [Anaerolineaceae bacterium]